MALKSVVADLSEVDESLQSHYTEKDGSFYLDLEDFGKHPGAVTLKTTLNKVNREKSDLAAKVAEWEPKITGLPDDFDAAEWVRLKSGAKPDEQIQTLKEQHQRAVDALKTKLEAVSGQVAERDSYIDGTTRSGALSAALDEAGFDPTHKPMLAKFLADQVKVRREDDGRRVAFVETDLGEVSPLEFVKDFAGKAGKAYLAKATGPGAPGSQRPGNPGSPQGNFGGSIDDRRRAIAAKFPELGR